MKNLSKLEPTVELFNRYLNLETEIYSNTDHFRNPTRSRIIAFSTPRKRYYLSENYLRSLKILLLPQDPLIKKKNVVLEIKKFGGNEANLFAADLLRTLLNTPESKKWKVEILNLNPSIKGGLFFRRTFNFWTQYLFFFKV
ncbi:PCRF domain-containing protein [Areca yellow leaf disease phytoplasma]|uniref:PCRF domain-containing protein n=1 Tax=Areca yellow leaf disease phytoplasma TaxID=927614 RepID=UPI0035B559AB